MGNSKSVKKGVAVVTAVIVAVVMVCVSVVCNLLSTKTDSSNQTYLDDAKAQLTEYSDNYNYTKFEFIALLSAIFSSIGLRQESIVSCSTNDGISNSSLLRVSVLKLGIVVPSL